MLSQENQEQGYDTPLITPIQHHNGNPRYCNKKEIKGIKIGKEKNKILLIHKWHDLPCRKSKESIIKNGNNKQL